MEYEQGLRVEDQELIISTMKTKKERKRNYNVLFCKTRFDSPVVLAGLTGFWVYNIICDTVIGQGKKLLSRKM
jgi:hypothetical protein